MSVEFITGRKHAMNNNPINSLKNEPPRAGKQYLQHSLPLET